MSVSCVVYNVTICDLLNTEVSCDINITFMSMRITENVSVLFDYIFEGDYIQVKDRSYVQLH